MIHLCAAVGAIENARQRIWLSVRLVNTPLRSPQPLNDIPCFFVNDLRVRVLEYKPVFGGGFPLLGFIVFRSRLVQDFPAHIFLFLEDVDDGGARPFIRVCIVRPAARPFADAFPMCVGGQYPLGGQFLRDFCDVLSRNHAPEYPLYNGSGFLVYDPFLAVFRVVEVAVGQCARNVVSRRRPRAEYRPDFAAGVSCVPLRKDIAKGHKIVLAFGGVDALRNGDQPDVHLPKLFQKQAHAQMVTPQAAHILYQDLPHAAARNILRHLQKARSVPARPAPAVVRPVDEVFEAASEGVFLQIGFLVLNGQALVFPPVLMAQPLIKDCQFFVVHASLFPAQRLLCGTYGVRQFSSPPFRSGAEFCPQTFPCPFR